MTNIERHGFDNAKAASEFAASRGLKTSDLVSGTQVWLDYARWLYEDAGGPKPVEAINHPAHYRHRSGFDAIVWIDRFEMDFCTGNCFKYLFRRGLKPGEPFEKDGEKAKWYFRHEAEIYHARSLAWDEAKHRAAEKLIQAFGRPGELADGSPDWSTGGCDMPVAIEFIEHECLTMELDD